MNTKKLVTMSLLGLASAGIMTANTYAFGGHNMDADRYEELKTMILNATSYEDFKTMMEAKREEHKAERQAFKDSVTKTVVNLANGVEVTMTSEDADVVAKLQNREHKEPKNEEVTKITTNLANGIKITITAEDEDLIKRIQARAERKGNGMDHGRHGRRGGDFSQDSDQDSQNGFGRRGRGGFRGFFGEQNQDQ